MTRYTLPAVALLLACLAAAPATKPSECHSAVEAYKAAKSQLVFADKDVSEKNSGLVLAESAVDKALSGDNVYVQLQAEAADAKSKLDESRKLGGDPQERLSLSSRFNSKKAEVKSYRDKALIADSQIQAATAAQKKSKTARTMAAANLASADQVIKDIRARASAIDQSSLHSIRWADGESGSPRQSLKVISIVDERSLIVTVNTGTDSSTLVWLEGWDTTKLTTDSYVDLRSTTIRIEGTKRYTTVLGATNQILRAVPWKVSDEFPDYSELDEIPQ